MGSMLIRMAGLGLTAGLPWCAVRQYLALIENHS